MFSNKNKEITISSIIEALRMFVHLPWKKKSELLIIGFLYKPHNKTEEKLFS